MADSKASKVYTICLAVMETVREVGDVGAPRGLMYLAAMSAKECSYEEWQLVESIVTASGQVEIRGDRLYHKGGS